MSLKALIEARKNKLNQLGDPGDDEQKKAEKAKLEAEIAALEEADADKEVFSQDDLNRIDQQAKADASKTKDRIEKMFGTSIDSVEEVLQRFDNVLPTTGDQGDQGGQGDGDTGKGDAGTLDLNRVLGELKKRDDTIQNLQQNNTQFQRMFFGNEINREFEAKLNAMGLAQPFAETAKNYLNNVVGTDDLLEKRLKGEQVTEEEITQKAEAVKNASPVWFQAVPNPDAPEIPVTPDGGTPKTFTDEERKQVSVASGGRVF